MFRPNCRAIIRLIFEQAYCTIDNAFHLRDFVLQELVKIISLLFNKLRSQLNVDSLDLLN